MKPKIEIKMNIEIEIKMRRYYLWRMNIVFISHRIVNYLRINLPIRLYNFIPILIVKAILMNIYQMIHIVNRQKTILFNTSQLNNIPITNHKITLINNPSSITTHTLNNHYSPNFETKHTKYKYLCFIFTI